ncbi:PIN domain-containing protein [Raoultibacter phocaeensis]|uniref:PIN domain-containing protein n=1 Tax=Raoultibacter phocaeensis TaxID=2479841 RepID=UPI00111B6C94|nr:PIN domain-containing protein [Raoultibacter phocaeensis]
MITIIDESVILRYLLNDDKRKAKQAAKLIADGHAYSYPEIFARVAVTLRDVYGVPRSLVSEALLNLLDDIRVSEEDIVRYATRLFGASMLDYIDCLLVARNHLYNHEIVSFDKPLMKNMM